MFCPRCGAQNETQAGYCRQCGQALTTVRRALDGRTEEAIASFYKGTEWVASGLLTLGIFVVVGIVAALGFGVAAALFDLVLGLLVAGPMIFSGFRRLTRAQRLLPALDEAARALPAGAPAQAARLPSPQVDTTNELPAPPRPGSVTEGTTLKLK